MCQVLSEPHILIFSIMIIYEIATYPFVISGSRIILKCWSKYLNSLMMILAHHWQNPTSSSWYLQSSFPVVTSSSLLLSVSLLVQYSSHLTLLMYYHQWCVLLAGVWSWCWRLFFFWFCSETIEYRFPYSVGFRCRYSQSSLYNSITVWSVCRSCR